ncbi:MAG: sugar ABC transporter substrate-binding protein [Paracoccus sp. (in: a-proteobacteria)]|nr:sugar ABC transporter substrate-binding protein [Paracoccus sp. (in: a-proteobacteria)]
MSKRSRHLALALLMVSATTAGAQDFNWRAHEGETVRFLANSNPIGKLLSDHEAEFEALTGINLVIDSYQEQQMRQRLMTVMNARSDEMDVFMTLPSREGMQFAAAGWYRDLMPYLENAAPDYDADGFAPSLIEASTFDGKLVGVPLNIEGPLLYYRTDIFQECGLDAPASLEDIRAAAETLKECSDVTPFASRGLAAATPYTFSAFMHNMGGEYMVNGESAMCSQPVKDAIALYAGLLQDYGPPGVVNYSFQQLTALYRAGRSAMSFESSNELSGVMEGGDRLGDTAIIPLPAGPGGSHPTVIGWSLAISGNAANPDAAWYFLQWASSPGMQEKFALAGIAPPRAAVSEAPEYKAWLEESPVRKQWQQALTVLAETGTSEIGLPINGNPESREYIGQAVGEVLLGGNVDDACAKADIALNELITRE